MDQLTPATPSHIELDAKARIILVVSIVVTLLLYVVPYGYYVAYPLLLISTVVHEMGHGVAAWIVGGEFRELHIMKDTSGYAITATHGDFANAMVLGGGLIGPAVGAAVSFVMARRATTARVCLVLIGGDSSDHGDRGRTKRLRSGLHWNSRRGVPRGRAKSLGRGGSVGSHDLCRAVSAQRVFAQRLSVRPKRRGQTFGRAADVKRSRIALLVLGIGVRCHLADRRNCRGVVISSPKTACQLISKTE